MKKLNYFCWLRKVQPLQTVGGLCAASKQRGRTTNTHNVKLPHVITGVDIFFKCVQFVVLLWTCHICWTSACPWERDPSSVAPRDIYNTFFPIKKTPSPPIWQVFPLSNQGAQRQMLSITVQIVKLSEVMWLWLWAVSKGNNNNNNTDLRRNASFHTQLQHLAEEALLFWGGPSTRRSLFFFSPGSLEHISILLTFLESRLFLLTPQASSCSLPLRASSTSIHPRRPEEIQSFQKDV